MLRTDTRRWWGLLALGLGQLMIAVDATIVTIALPSLRHDLGLSADATRWVVAGFALAFGGCLLLGGRLSDLLGRRRCLLVGVLGFAAASLLGGLAFDATTIIAARVLQGVFGALYTPAALALLGTSFTTPEDRARAFGIWGTIMGSSSGVGLVLGGTLTQVLDWRWSMYLGLPLAAVALIGILATVVPAPGTGGRIDVVGAVLATAGLAMVVHGWWFGAVPLAVFWWHQHRTPNPLLPPRVLRHPARAGAYLAVLALSTASFGALYDLTFHLQTTLGLGPALAGVAFLPYTAAILLAAHLRVPFPLVSGLVLAGLAVVLLGGGSYWTDALPSMVLMGLGGGWVMAHANNTATRDAGPDAGVAGAAVPVSMQIGASIGVTLAA
ncbi:MFS transporter [Saccharothrix variisporea]|uniref:Putative MFS family arabinose efflux permease n=1 Tax=Saccharothrix variisporea TaxID=543527 RepID=A0A495X0P8_9PSEU|nr:MFS transporter [Saccharothrix variisporea]RKT67397.1 putative MFS family arabinose efflux permease [Saccharothrix variisporea]